MYRYRWASVTETVSSCSWADIAARAAGLRGSDRAAAMARSPVAATRSHAALPLRSGSAVLRVVAQSSVNTADGTTAKSDSVTKRRVRKRGGAMRPVYFRAVPPASGLCPPPLLHFSHWSGNR